VSLPPDYVSWAQSHDLNAWHPDEWPDAGRAAFRAWKRAFVVHRRVAWMDSGVWDLLSPDRRAEIRAEDVAFTEAPPPSRPYKRCPCHMFGGPGPVADLRLPEERASAAEVAAWVGADPLQRAQLQPKVAACLAWLQATFGRPSR
jgi:hypothetical protein